MKKWINLTLLFLSVFLFTSCQIPGAIVPGTNDTEIETENNKPEVLKAEDFLPIKENVRYEYEGEGNEFASYVMVIDYTSGNMVQQRINNGGTEIVKVFKAGDGQVSELMSKGEVYFRENFLNSEFHTDEEKIILMEPIKVGMNWTLMDSSKKTITSISFGLETPSGHYEAVEVTTSNDQGEITNLDYYVKDVGLVKTVFSPGDNQISSTLSKVLEDELYEQTISFFYPNANDNILYYEDKIIRFSTNAETSTVLESAYSALGKVFSVNTKINSLKIDSENILSIDLNQAFVTEMSAGAMYESLILQSIANTFGKYYNAEKVSLTIEGKNYESGHILVEPGDLLPVDYSNAVKAE
ncbi:MAG: GerMN domain-containing protein [Eubacteriales bacterium]